MAAKREKPVGRVLSHIADVPVGIENPRWNRPTPLDPPPSPFRRFIYVQECRHLAESVGAPEERDEQTRRTDRRRKVREKERDGTEVP